MQARVKQDARYPTILALSGIEFTKKEWREVPVGKESEALRNQYLEIREEVVVEKRVTRARSVAQVPVEATVATEHTVEVPVVMTFTPAPVTKPVYKSKSK